MVLYLKAESDIPDLMIDFIEVKLKSGQIISLTWDESEFDREDGQFEARYKGVYTLSVEEACAHFRIGENKLRKIINERPDADFILWNGSRVLIKRTLFEKFIDTLESI